MRHHVKWLAPVGVLALIFVILWGFRLHMTTLWFLALTAAGMGIWLWISSSRFNPRRLGVRLLGLALLAAPMVWLVGRVLFETFSNHYDSPGWWIFNAFNPFLHVPPMFKWWGFILWILAFVFWVMWHREIRRTSVYVAPADNPRVRRMEHIVRGLTALLLVSSIGSIDWNDLHFGPLHSSSTSNVLEAPGYTLTDNKDLTITVEVPKEDGWPRADWQYHWTVEIAATNAPVPNAIPGVSAKEVSIKLPGANTYTVKLFAQKGDKKTVTFGKSVVVTGPNGQTPPVNPNQTIANGCPDSWVIRTTNPPDNAITDAIASIPDANDHKSDSEARQAWIDWMEQAKQYPDAFKVIIDLNTQEQVDSTSLVDGGCASALATGYRVKLLNLAHDPNFHVTPELAPSNGTNTGRDSGGIVQNSVPGVNGDRRAIKVTLPNGRVYWVLGRCGNVVFVGNSPVELPNGRTGGQQVTASGPTSSSPQSATTSSAPAPGPTSTPTRGSTTTTPAAPTSHAPAPTTGKDQAQAPVAPYTVSDSTGDLHPSGGSSASAASSASSQTVPAGQQTSEVGGGVAPSGSAAPTGVGTSNQGSSGPPPD